MATFGGLTDSTLLYLYGFTVQQEQETYLTSNISDSELTLPMADLTAVSRGVIEIGDELIRIDDVNQTGLVAVAPPYGRGYRGTTAAAHTTGTKVVTAPLFPRKLVKDALNQSILSVFPMLAAIGEDTFTYSPAVSTYALPASAQNVLSVMWQSVGPSQEWLPVRRWRVDTAAATSAFPTGATLSVYDGITPGRTIKVVYTKPPTTLSAESDEFSTTGLSASAEDVIRLGAAWRLAPFLDAPHLSGNSAEADFSANMRPVGAAAQFSRTIQQQYQLRLLEESQRQQDLFPVRAHYTR